MHLNAHERDRMRIDWRAKRSDRDADGLGASGSCSGDARIR